MQVEPVRRIPAPAPADFARDVLAVDRPVVLEGALGDWKALGTWDGDYLRSKAGDHPVECMKTPDELPDGYISPGCWRRTDSLGRTYLPCTLREYLDDVWVKERPRVYLRLTLPRGLPQLAEDYSVPAYLAGTDRVVQALWIGAPQTVAIPHYDVSHNLHALVFGRKRFLMFDRNVGSRLYPHGILSGYFEHTSRIHDVEAADQQRFPRMRGLVATEAVLEPGDLLYVPVGWWHQVQTLVPSIAVSFWWGPGLPALHRVNLRRKAFYAYRKVYGMLRRSGARRSSAPSS